MFALNWLTGFRREDLNNFPIGSYVKTMSADGGHFEPRSINQNTLWALAAMLDFRSAPKILYMTIQ